MGSEMFDNTLVVKTMPDQHAAGRGERQGTLTVLIGADVGATHSLTGPVLIGRGPEAQVSLDDDGISRRHCRIIRGSSAYELEDLGSTNGSYVDYERVQGRIQLHDGARIQAGNTVLRFALQDRLEQETSRRMYEMAVRDGLTAAYNRRYFDERLESEFAFALRHGSALCVLLIDIDHFKRVNDTHGHHGGDEVLRRVSAVLRNGVRAEDVVARYGGEEFGVIARGIDVAGARMFAERVRSMIERAHIEWEGGRIAVTASIGLAHNHSGAALNKPERLVLAADNALYAAKDSGRNRVELACSPGRYSSGESRDGERHTSSRTWETSTTPNDASPPGARPSREGRRPAPVTQELDEPARRGKR
jgi:two-component system, cell cycle response regulator